MACGCSRLRLAGTTLDGKFGLHPYSWDGLFGFPGKSGENERIVGRDGAYRQTGKMALERSFTLGLKIYPEGTDGLVTLTDCEHIEANLDEILGIVGQDDLVQLEWDAADGTTRFLEVEFVDAMEVDFDGFTMQLPLVGLAPYPMWRSENLITDTVTGTQSKVFGGNAPEAACIVEFGAAGRLTDNTQGDYVEVSGAGYPVVVDCKERTVLQGTTPVPNRFSPGNSRWLRPRPGSVSFTSSSGGITLKHRDSWW